MTIPGIDISNYEGDEWKSYFDSFGMYDIFEELVFNYGAHKDVLKAIVRYMTEVYSAYSKKVLIGSDWMQNKKNIAKCVGLDINMPDPVIERILPDQTVLHPPLYETILLRQSPYFSRTVEKWLQFQNEENYSIWCMISDLILENRIAANSCIRKNTGEIDYPQKEKCAMSVLDLTKRKKDIEQELLQNHPTLKEAYLEVSKDTTRESSNSGKGMEFYLKNRTNVSTN